MVGVGEASTVKEAKKAASAMLLARLQGARAAAGAGVSVNGGGGGGFGVGSGGRAFAPPAAYHSGDPYSPSAGGHGGVLPLPRPGMGGGSSGTGSAYDSHLSGPAGSHYAASLSLQQQAPQAPPDATSTLNVRLQTMGFLNPADALRETGRAHVSDMPEWWQLGLEIRELGVSAVGQGGTVKAARKDAAAKLLAQLEGSSGSGGAGGGGSSASAAGGGGAPASLYGARPPPPSGFSASSPAPAFATPYEPSGTTYRPQAAAPHAAGRPPPHHPAYTPYGPTGGSVSSGGGYEYSFGHPSPAAAYPMHTAMPAAHGYGYGGEGSPESGRGGSSSGGSAPLSQSLLVAPPPHVLAAMRGISSGPAGMPGASSFGPASGGSGSVGGGGYPSSGGVTGSSYPPSGPSRPTQPQYGYAVDEELPPWVQGSGGSETGRGSAGLSGRSSSALPSGAFEGPSSARSSISAGGASIGSGGGGTSSRRGSGSLLGPPPMVDPRRAGAAGVAAGSSGSIGSGGGVHDSMHDSGGRTGGE
jgi:hypothetical protein